MMKALRILLAFAVAGFIVLTFLAPFTAARAVPACNDTPCLVGNDAGGGVDDYDHLAKRLVRTGEPLQLAGDCYSACTALADRARPYVCLFPGARLFIHQSTVGGGPYAGLRMDVKYSADIAAWIRDQGGQPDVGYLLMDYDTARRFWPACKSPG